MALATGRGADDCHRGRCRVSGDGSDIGLDSACDYWLDVLCFESLAQKGLQTPLEEIGSIPFRESAEQVETWTC